MLGFTQAAIHVFHELGDTDIVVLKELNDVHFLSILCLTLGHVSVLLQEFGHRDVAVGWLIIKLLIGMLVHIVLKELDNGHINIAFVGISRAGIRIVSRCSSI